MIINVYNEFDKLNSVILGRVSIKFNKEKCDIFKKLEHNIYAGIKYYDEIEEERDKIRKVLTDFGTEVIDVPEYTINDLLLEKKYVSSLFQYTTRIGSPRNNLFALDNTLVECSGGWLSSCKHTQHMKTFFNSIQEPNKFISMPEERIQNDYDRIEDSFKNKPPEFFTNYVTNKDFRIQIDGANILKCGTDIFVNIASKNNITGFRWLKEMFPDFNFHPISIARGHIDGTLLILKVGLILMHDGLKNCWQDFIPKQFHSWDKIFCKKYDRHVEEFSRVDQLVHGTTDINVLSLDSSTVMVEDYSYKFYKDAFKNYNIEAIPVSLKFGKVYIGGFHCMTSCLNRNGKKESYFDS